MTLRLHILLLVALFGSGCMSYHQGPMPGEPEEAAYTTVGDTRVRYHDSGGEGPPVVMIHGFASALDTWAAVMPRLEKEHRVIALDLRGFGWTDRPDTDYSPQAQARLVFGLLDELGVDETAIVAHSWGSSVALQMALQQPGRIERLALYDAWVYEEQLPVAFRWARAPVVGELIFGLFYQERPGDKMELAFHDPDILEHEFVEEVREALDRPGTRAAALAAVRGQRYAEIQERYAEVDQPVLLLWGEEDVVTTPDFGVRLHHQLPNSTMRTYANCGHFPMIEAYWPSTNALVDFLSERLPTATMRSEPGSDGRPDPDDTPLGTPEPVEEVTAPTKPEVREQPESNPVDRMDAVDEQPTDDGGER